MIPRANGVPVAETLITVRSPEIDSFGHVNHAVFLNYLEHARYEALEAAGFRWPTLEERDWQIYVVRLEVEYLSQARRGDALLVRTWAAGFRRTTMDLAQEIVRADNPGRLVVRALVQAVWVGPDRRPMRVPADVRAGLTGERAGAEAER
ncbi:MAG TPA: thioesterase family protein [Longimicrobiales bacterium]|nr:thioesterase family protein [Longimicrobiales bacterium]